MGLNLTQKIIKEHLVSGEMIPGSEIGLKIDQTITQDATGTMAYLQFEAMGIPRVKTKLSVSYVDHNMLQTGFENADDHIYLQTVASKHGIYFSRPGNGICHQVHLERFAVPGATQLGSDSHTPTAGGIGALAIGVGGLDVAVAMGGGAFFTKMPKVVNVELKGKLQPWVSAKDIVLELLRKLTVKGGVGRVFEYGGEGVASLTVPERATITNMGAELGATTSIFPSDTQTENYLKAQKRHKDFQPLAADVDATYDETVVIDLNTLEPMIACPHSPDKVVRVSDVAGTPVQQVAVGSCTNSSFTDLMRVGLLLRGRHVNSSVSMVATPGSKQVLEMIARNGVLADYIAAGVRLLESACGPCIGMGQAPSSKAVSIRSFNRNFEGRSGTADAQVYLASPETCVACAIFGVITDPRKLGDYPSVDMPVEFLVDDSMVIAPAEAASPVEVIRGPNIKPLPINKPLAKSITGEVLLKVGDNITTDHIMPAGAKILPLRSNIPGISEYVFTRIDSEFSKRAKEKNGGFIVGGENYGQGSSREHAALAPMYLGVKAVLVKSFARIHRSNLVNFGLIPIIFENPVDYDRINQGDALEFMDIFTELKSGKITVKNVTQGFTFTVKHDLSPREMDVIYAGGLLNYTREKTQY